MTTLLPRISGKTLMIGAFRLCCLLMMIPSSGQLREPSRNRSALS